MNEMSRTELVDEECLDGKSDGVRGAGRVAFDVARALGGLRLCASLIAGLLFSLAVTSTAAAQSSSNDTTPATPTTPTGLISEPRLFDKTVALANRWLGEGDVTSTPRDGFYPELGNMMTGSGWISLGPGYRRHFFDGHGLVDASTAISWRAYKMAQARFELTDLAANRLTMGSQIRWQDLTQVNYFGAGADSIEDARSEYRLKNTDVVGYGTYHATQWLAIDGTFGWLRHSSLSAPAGPFRGDYPDTRLAFSDEPGVSRQPNYLHGGAAVTADFRDYPGHPTRGGLYRAGLATYSDRDFSQFSFRRYEAEGLQIVPLTTGGNWIVAVHGWGVFSDTSSANEVPFYMLPSLGGQNTLRGYFDYRFHDRNMLLASAESRWALFRDIDAVAFFDAGNVASRVSDLNLKKTSWGGGLRVHSQMWTLARLDVGHSVEGWHVFLRFSDPFRLKRRSQRTADAPFVP
jgi:Omp85 superfamily domain